jgi:AMP-polyphosphate phosphotransferase
MNLGSGLSSKGGSLVLESVDLKKKLTKAGYDKHMRELQERLRKLQYEARDAQIPIIICLEGWDTAGKGQVVKKLTERLDPRLFRVVSGKPPTPLEQRYHFLWRYQVALPNDGEMAVLDHSWYGRVLVERVDRLVKRALWTDAYQQINEFERWLADDGQVVVKFWMHISKKEQKKRFRDCLKDPLLRWKITKEYKRHHRQYGRWVEAVEEMIARTDTPHAPWTIVESNDMRYARVKVFRTLVAAIEASLIRQNKLQAPPPVKEIKKKKPRAAKVAVAVPAPAGTSGNGKSNGQQKSAQDQLVHS